MDSSPQDRQEPNERHLYARMIARALRDVMGGAEPEVVRQADGSDPAAERRLEKAQMALGWIFDEVGGGPNKERCGGRACPPEPGLEDGPCRSWTPGSLCRRVTFEEACQGMSPDLNPQALREKVLGLIRQNGLELA